VVKEVTAAEDIVYSLMRFTRSLVLAVAGRWMQQIFETSFGSWRTALLVQP
jgi:hypothetical protein